MHCGSWLRCLVRGLRSTGPISPTALLRSQRFSWYRPVVGFLPDLPVRACAVCGFILDIVRDGSGYLHGRPSDHVVVPVDPLEIYTAWACDFCNSPEPVAVLPARDFLYPGDTRDGSRGNWLVCASQAPYIAANDWDGLLADVARCWPQQHDGEELTGSLRAMLGSVYRALQHNITGPLQPFSPQTAMDRPAG